MFWYILFLFRSGRFNNAEIGQQLLLDIPEDSDFERDSDSEFVYYDNDEEFLARRRERGEDDTVFEEVADPEDKELPDLHLPGDDDDGAVQWAQKYILHKKYILFVFCHKKYVLKRENPFNFFI